jgi:hypothetical protein
MAWLRFSTVAQAVLAPEQQHWETVLTYAVDKVLAAH